MDKYINIKSVIMSNEIRKIKLGKNGTPQYILPEGGIEGQVLVKTADGETWGNVSGGGSNIICTNAANTPAGVTWNNAGTTVTGTLAASADTANNKYFVPASKTKTKNIYKEYLTVNNGSTYIWEELGTVDLDLDLTYIYNANMPTTAETFNALKDAVLSHKQILWYDGTEYFVVTDYKYNSSANSVELRRETSNGYVKGWIEQGYPEYTSHNYIKEPYSGEEGQVLKKTEEGVEWADEAGQPTLIKKTYSELKTLRDSSSLVPGIQYQITDYQCTTSDNYTTSAGHTFDIIVTADSENKLNENARAVLHSGDTYFSGCRLETWELKYSLDNDASLFDWADTSTGKGVIYWMKDEQNNECPYDFKSIQFYRTWDASVSLWSNIVRSGTAGAVACYTFSSSGASTTTSFSDISIIGSYIIHNNVIKDYFSRNILSLNNNCFFGYSCYSNTFGTGSSRNTFETNTFNNIFGNMCNNNKFKMNTSYNIVGNYYYSNKSESNFTSNIFGNKCQNNIFGTYFNENIIGNDCQNITVGNNCAYNKFGNGSLNIIFGNECDNNTIGNRCRYIKFSSDDSGTSGDYFSSNIVDSEASFNILYNTESASMYNAVKNYHIKSSMIGTTSSINRISASRNLAYDMTVAKKSNGTTVTYCEADLVQN